MENVKKEEIEMKNYPTFVQALNKKWTVIALVSFVMFILSFNPIGWIMAGFSLLLLVHLLYEAETTSIGFW